MPRICINDRSVEVPAGTTVLGACQSAGVAVPTLCHDERLKPAGACRLCLVEVAGGTHPVPACCTEATEGLRVTTHSPELEDFRRNELQLLADTHPAAAVAEGPESPFLRWLHHYDVSPSATAPPGDEPPFTDFTHPYLRVDMGRCIDCFRCVRICEEVQGQSVWHVLGRGPGTRIVPDSGTSLLTSSCVSCGACADTCPTGAIADQSVHLHGTPRRWMRTVCPYCGVGCELDVGTRDQRIVQVKPAADAPVNRGHLCVKGRYAFGFNDAPDRVTEPMIRRDGAWQRVGWDEAVAFVAKRLGEIVRESGPDSIGVLGSARGTNEENYLAQKFARVVLGTNNVDCCARVCHAPTAAGMKATLGTGAATNSFADIEQAQAFLLCGCNPTEGHPVVGARLRQAVRHGAKLLVMDPRATELARLADVHLALRPGTNVPLLNALAHVVVTENLTDSATVRDRVADFAAFREFIAAWPPERAAELTGVSADEIRRAARLYATVKPAMCFHGLGTTEHVQGTDGVMGLVNLALLTGNFGKAGSGVNPLRGQNNVQGAAHMGCEPANLTGYVALGQARELFESVWRTSLPPTPGLNLMEMVDAAGAGKLRALWAIGYDVALTNPDANATRAALGRLDLVIVQDLFLNELARDFAQVFLPACSSFEKDGTFMNSERRVQRVRRVIGPPGAAKPDWEILCRVAQAMLRSRRREEADAPTGFDFASAEEIWDEVRRVWPAGAGISYARLERGGLQWPCPTEGHPGTPLLHAATFPQGPRAALQCLDYVASGEVPDAEFPFLLTTGRDLYQFNAGTMTGRTANAQLRATDTLDVAPADAVRLGLHAGDRVRLHSRHGEAVLPVQVDERVQRGQLFATFHAVETALNRVTGPRRDRVTGTPEYKVVAVRLDRI